MSREAATTATLLITAREALEKFVEVRVDDDGALSFRHGDVPCAVQGIELVADTLEPRRNRVARLRVSETPDRPVRLRRREEQAHGATPADPVA